MGFHSPKMDLQRPPHKAFPIPKIGPKPSNVDFLGPKMNMQSLKLSPKTPPATIIDLQLSPSTGQIRFTKISG